MVKTKTKIGKQVQRKQNPGLVKTIVAAKKKKDWVVIAGILSGCVQISVIIAMLVFPNITFDSTAVSSFSENGLKQDFQQRRTSRARPMAYRRMLP